MREKDQQKKDADASPSRPLMTPQENRPGDLPPVSTLLANPLIAMIEAVLHDEETLKRSEARTCTSSVVGAKLTPNNLISLCHTIPHHKIPVC